MKRSLAAVLIVPRQTFRTDAFNKQLCFAKNIPLWQFYSRNADFWQAQGSGAVCAAKMHMFVVVLMLGAAYTAQGKAGGAGIVQHLVQEATRLKGAQDPIEGDSVERGREHFL